jgi:outer membrane protein assembly factor BamB
LTLPHPWGQAAIDANGTVYIGNEEGPFYALADQDGDGLVQGESEVSSIDTGACFHGDSTVIIAPGILVTSNTDTLFVFKAS